MRSSAPAARPRRTPTGLCRVRLDVYKRQLLNAVRLVCQDKESLCGELRFIFQHAEETPPGGAVEVIAAGVLEGVDEVYGLHLTSILPTGRFGVCPGVLTSSTDRFDVTVQGKGGHSSMPQELSLIHI